MNMQLTSIAFQSGQAIPAQYTADGNNISPPLKWTDPPAGAKSLALICEDPDARRGTWTHWIVWNLPIASRELGEAVPATVGLPNGTTQGVNDFTKIGYGGPAPPRGKPHRYVFKLFALDKALAIKGGATKQQLLNAMTGHVLAESGLTGAYGRKA